MSLAYVSEVEATERFGCFGGQCAVLVSGQVAGASAREGARWAKGKLQRWDRDFSRFDPASELSRLNADPRRTVHVSPAMARFVESVVAAATMSDGLVDGTLVAEIEAAGYAEDFAADSLPLAVALRLIPDRQPAAPARPSRWQEIRVDRAARNVARPPGVRFDTGGIAKGLFGDLLALSLGHHTAFVVDAAGDLRFGGWGQLVRPVQVACPFTDSILHTFELTSGAAATSGIGNRSWLGANGLPAHHLLDPSTGRPAFTGVVQATALAPSGVEAEVLSKAAVLSGPAEARRWLPHGGLIVLDDGGFETVEPFTAGLTR
jgi:thiamine biosynthesis lipoprotein